MDKIPRIPGYGALVYWYSCGCAYTPPLCWFGVRRSQTIGLPPKLKMECLELDNFESKLMWSYEVSLFSVTIKKCLVKYDEYVCVSKIGASFGHHILTCGCRRYFCDPVQSIPNLVVNITGS